MPCTTDDDNAFEILLLCRTYHFTHPRFTYQVTRRGVPRKFFPKSSHSLLYRLKNIGRFLPVFNHSFPPGFTISKSCGMSQPVERVAGFCDFSGRFRLLFRGLFCPKSQRIDQRQVEKAERYPVLYGIKHRLPLGRELRKRVEHCILRLVRLVCQQSYRRRHLRIFHTGQQRFGFCRTFYQNQIRLQFLQVVQHIAARAGTVMPDA